MIVLAGAGTLFVLARRSPAIKIEEVAASAVAASASTPPVLARNEASPLGDLTHADASDLYPKVKQRATQWSSGARLISIVASPVVGTQVDLSAPGSELVYQFAAGVDATGREQPPGRLSLRVTREGIKPGAASEPATSPGGEPNCVSDAAAKAARASGIPANQPMKLRYEVDRALRRGVWIATALGRRDLERVIDGKTCAILVRH